MEACTCASAQGAAIAAVAPRAGCGRPVGASRSVVAAHSSSSSSLGGAHFLGLRRLGGHALTSELNTVQADPFSDVRHSICHGERAQGSRGVVTAMAGTGKFFVGGNWKCNGTRESVKKLIADLNAQSIADDVDVVVAPPFVYIDQVLGSITDRIEVAAQNCWVGKGGAFTGEVSAEMLKDIGLNWVILGHSERRQLIGESNEFVGKKEAYALNGGLNVIGCIGETLEQREAGKTIEVVAEQLQAMREQVPSWDNVVVAYEPIWAIGTGKVATPAQAQEVHQAIRGWLADNVSPSVASATRIIYGGSVNAKNCEDLAREEDIDGFLVGGASLIGPDFATIVNSVNAKKVAA